MGPELIEAVSPAHQAVPVRLWIGVFTLACYAAAAGAIYYGIREGARTRWYRAVSQVGLFGFFAVAFWAVESWAHFRTPYYLYAPFFSDLIPRIPFGSLGVSPGISNACTDLVTTLQAKFDLDKIPLSIVLMEASLTYSAMWTARRLGANLVVQPLLAALVMVNIDVLLDPVLASTHDCNTGAALPRAGIGLGLWRWYVDPTIAASWYGVPVFNYGAWFTAPVLLIALTNLAGPFLKDWLIPRYRSTLDASKAPAGWEGALLLIMAVSIGFMFYITPGKLGPTTQWALMATLLAVAVAIVFGRVRHYKVDHSVEPCLTRPTALALTIPAVALFIEGFFVELPTLVPVGIFCVGFGLLLVWLPYRPATMTACERIADVDRFVRLHYFGFTAIVVLVGAAVVRPDPDKWLLAGLLFVAACYHVYGYVLNDVIDLDLDRRQGRRGRDPLVRGAISRESACAIAIVPVPFAILVSFLLGVNALAWTALAIALGLAIIYNLWGKEFRFPPLTDLVQGVAWTSLAFYAAWAAAPHTDLATLIERGLPLYAYAVGFILLINGIHGGLRDLWTDVTYGKNTTAIYLGAKPSFDGPTAPAESSVGVIGFAFIVHTLMFAPAFVFLARNAPPAATFGPLAYWVSAGLVGVIFAASNWLLWRVVRRKEEHRGWWISTHLFVLLLPPLVLYVPSGLLTPVFKVFVLCCFFVPLLLQVGIVERLVRLLAPSERAPAPEARPRESVLPPEPPAPVPEPPR